MMILPNPGLTFDQPNVAPTPFWTVGFNVRFRLGSIETVGLFGPMRDVDDNRVVLPVVGGPFRKIFTTPNTQFSQIIAGSVDAVWLLEYDPNSTPVQGTRYLSDDITPVGLSAESDVLPNPSPGRVQIPPVWWFSDQDDLVVGSRAGVVNEVPYVWDRNRVNSFVPITPSDHPNNTPENPVAPTPVPVGAVGGGILNRILVLLGCTSFSDPDPSRFMTIRWSDRFDFGQWTPSDITISGELQLEGGSRIVGGGVTGFGVVAWTDKRMALLVENFDPDSVFTRKYIDGGRGLLGNNSWCEADGQVWWMDEARVLNVYDGGRPRQIPNPLKYGTIERLGDRQLARVYLEANPEYSEVIIHFPDEEEDNPDAQLVYNYVDNVWAYWRFSRTGWHRRIGSIPTVGIAPDGGVYFHDLDISLPDKFLSVPPLPLPGRALPQPIGPGTKAKILADDVDPFDFAAYTNLITTENVTDETWTMRRIHADHFPLPAEGAETDVFLVRLLGYGEAEIDAPLVSQDFQAFEQGKNADDFRVGGKALRIGVVGEQVKTVFRFSGFSVSVGGAGQR
jgi:hypothetical protein